MVTKIQFILGYSIFLFFVMQISAMAGEAIITGVNSPDVPSPPVKPERGGFGGFWDGITGIIGYIFDNIGYFFSLMGASSTFGLFGTMILTPFIIVLLWIIIELIRGV